MMGMIRHTQRGFWNFYISKTIQQQKYILFQLWGPVMLCLYNWGPSICDLLVFIFKNPQLTQDSPTRKLVEHVENFKEK